MIKRRGKLAEQGLKEASSVVVPVHREAELRALARQWTEDHLSTLEESTERGAVGVSKLD